jgi:hypothetical protein
MYDAASAGPVRKRAAALYDLIEEGLVTLDPSGKPLDDADAAILIDGESAGMKIERGIGANESVLRIQGGAKIAFNNITVNGNIAPDNDGANANNRVISGNNGGTRRGRD